jgi:hypothetical protein
MKNSGRPITLSIWISLEEATFYEINVFFGYRRERWCKHMKKWFDIVFGELDWYWRNISVFLSDGSWNQTVDLAFK